MNYTRQKLVTLSLLFASILAPTNMLSMKVEKKNKRLRKARERRSGNRRSLSFTFNPSKWLLKKNRWSLNVKKGKRLKKQQLEVVESKKWLEKQLEIIDKARRTRVDKKFKLLSKQLKMQKGDNRKLTFVQLKELCFLGFASVRHPGDQLREQSNDFCSLVSDENLTCFFKKHRLKDVDDFKKKLLNNQNDCFHKSQTFKDLYNFGSKLILYAINSSGGSSSGGGSSSSGSSSLFSDKMILNFFQTHMPKSAKDFEEKLKKEKISICPVSYFKLPKKILSKVKRLVEQVDTEIIKEGDKEKGKENIETLIKGLAKTKNLKFTCVHPGIYLLIDRKFETKKKEDPEVLEWTKKIEKTLDQEVLEWRKKIKKKESPEVTKWREQLANTEDQKEQELLEDKIFTACIGCKPEDFHYYVGRMM